jgi:hypothetical protein
VKASLDELVNNGARVRNRLCRKRRVVNIFEPEKWRVVELEGRGGW